MAEIESLKSYIEYRKKKNIQYSIDTKRNNIQYSISNGSIKRNRKNYSEKAAQQKAMYLTDKFNNPGGMNFYLKVAWNLTDWYIDWLVNYSFKKNDPSRYFVKVASQKMSE